MIETSLSLSGMATLFAAMAVLAALPSVSVFAVTARAATHGFLHGALTAAGVVVGDLVFIVLAIFGLALLVEAMGELFFLIQLAGGLYLIWLGVMLWRSRAATAQQAGGRDGSRGSSFMTGLLITLADQKAVLFYLGFLPAFLDLAALSLFDTAIVAVIAVVAVGGVKLLYAAAAERAGRLLGARVGVLMNRFAAGLMIGIGVFLLLRL